MELDEGKLSVSKMNFPKHIGIIMDGNGRWANTRGWKRLQGHIQGADKVISIIEAAIDLDIKTLSLFCFSTENWRRPTEEVDFLMNLMHKFVEKQMQKLVTSNVKVKVLGDMEKAPLVLQEKLRHCIEASKANTGLNLNFMMSYGGRDDILRATQELSKKVAKGEISPDQITEELFSSHLYTCGQEDPDLIIRTSGEFRVSNFMLWQSAYAEYYVTQKLWPDFTEIDLKEACEHFAQRERRFGCVKHQEETLSL
jgi:undecaprenyl diphosphate synthase